MKIKISKEPVAIATIDIIKLKEELKKGMLPFNALKSAFSPELNEAYQDDETFFKNIFAETNWGTFFRIVETYPQKRVMTLKVHQVEYEGLPVLKKQIVDATKREFKFQMELQSDQDLIVMAEDTMTDPDVWIDAFIGNRVYDSVNSEWEKYVVELK